MRIEPHKRPREIEREACPMCGRAQGRACVNYLGSRKAPCRIPIQADDDDAEDVPIRELRQTLIDEFIRHEGHDD